MPAGPDYVMDVIIVVGMWSFTEERLSNLITHLLKCLYLNGKVVRTTALEALKASFSVSSETRAVTLMTLSFLCRGLWDWPLGKIIDVLHKSHNAPVPYPTMHHLVTEMCTFLLQNALWDL